MCILFCPICGDVLREIDGGLACERGKMQLTKYFEGALRREFSGESRVSATARLAERPRGTAYRYCPACGERLDSELHCPLCGRSLKPWGMTLIDHHPHWDEALGRCI